MSLGVLPKFRNRGIAQKLISQSMRAMVENYNLIAVFLHVRVSNEAAIHVYRDLLGFSLKATDDKYYGDGEDGYVMELNLMPLHKKFRNRVHQQQTENVDVELAQKSSSD